LQAPFKHSRAKAFRYLRRLIQLLRQNLYTLVVFGQQCGHLHRLEALLKVLRDFVKLAAKL
jgi:hypothetical protein